MSIELSWVGFGMAAILFAFYQASHQKALIEVFEKLSKPDAWRWYWRLCEVTIVVFMVGLVWALAVGDRRLAVILFSFGAIVLVARVFRRNIDASSQRCHLWLARRPLIIVTASLLIGLFGIGVAIYKWVVG